MPLFPNIDALEAYVDLYVKTNGNNEITGEQGNVSLNGCIEFIRQSPLNWAEAAVYNQTAPVTVTVPVNVFPGSQTPTALTFGDNIYNEFVFVNMTSVDIPFSGSLGYYGLAGTFIDEVPANSAINIFKASNDLWILGSGGSGGGGGSVQKEPDTYIVGTTPNAPADGSTTWTLPVFANSYIVLFINRGGATPTKDGGDGGPYTTKTLVSTTLTLNNGQFTTGDILTYISITP